MGADLGAAGQGGDLGRRDIENAVCQWTTEKKYRVDRLVKKLTERCDELELYTTDPGEHLEVAAYVTTLVMNHRFTGRFKRTKSP